MNTNGWTTSQVEAKGIEWGCELLTMWQKPGTNWIDTHKCRQREMAQRTFGDFIFTDKWNDEVLAVEIKTERRYTGNLYLESWSNLTKVAGYRRDGWLLTLLTDVYVNIFLDAEVAYVMPFPDLRRWAVEEGNAYIYPERPAGASVAGEQRNMTMGFVVPLAAMLAGKHGSKPIRITKYARDNNGMWKLSPPSPPSPPMTRMA